MTPTSAQLPARFQDHGNPDKQNEEAGFNAPQMVGTVFRALRHNDVASEQARA